MKTQEEKRSPGFVFYTLPYSNLSWQTHLLMLTNMRARARARTHTHIYMYVCMYVYVRMYICRFV